MKRIPSPLYITQAKHIERYVLDIRFSDGTAQMVNFEPFLTNSLHSDVRKYLDIERFKAFRHEGGEFMWGDFDLIFPVADLYRNSVAS